MTAEQEQLVLQILSQFHKQPFPPLENRPGYWCPYCPGAGKTPESIDHAAQCVHLLSKALAATLPREKDTRNIALWIVERKA